jgi:hypothetical protein
LPNQLKIAAQILLQKWHEKKRWLLSSTFRKQKTHGKSWKLSKIPLWFRAERVGSLSNNKRQLNTRTLEGASILQSFLMVAKIFSSTGRERSRSYQQRIARANWKKSQSSRLPTPPVITVWV